MAETRIKSSGLSANISVGNLSLTGTTSVSGNVVPTSNNVVNLGSPTLRFGSLYLSGNTIDIGGAQITTTTGGDLSFNTASGNVAITANTVSFLTTVANTTTTTGNVSFSSNLTATSVKADAYFYTNGAAFVGGAGAAGYTGSQGSTGLGFAIAKSYLSVAALTADTAPTSITAGQFAVIETGSVQDADNAKLYLWSGSAYSYVTDLSGAAGITGPAGYAGSSGTTGNVGYTGSAGSAGSAGTTGYTGSTGSTGTAGSTGYTGSAGTAGSLGYTGSRGTTAFTAGNTAPASPGLGDMWYRTTNDALYRYLNDGTTSYWIDVTGPVNNFGTSATTLAAIAVSAPVIGQAFGGGYYAGDISATGNGVATHRLIVAPLATGSTASIQWKTSTTTTAGTSSSFDGLTNSANMNNASHPAAQFCEGLTIAGYTDWYLPSISELEICYYNLKPSVDTNYDLTVTNSYSVPSRASTAYTSGVPAQTTVANFKDTGTENFYVGDGGFYYWSSTENSATQGLVFNFHRGTPGGLPKTDNSNRRLVRAIRRVAI